MPRTMTFTLLLIGRGEPAPSDDAGAGSTGAASDTSPAPGTDPSTAGETTSPVGTTGGDPEAASSSTGPDPTSTTGGPTTDSGDPPATDSSGGSSSSSSGAAAIEFAQIELELENEEGEFGDYTSCVFGDACHSNPDRNVHIIANPTPAGLMQNWQNIVDVPLGVTPWVTPADDTAQMLNQTSIPDDVRARWLEWIEAGAPFE